MSRPPRAIDPEEVRKLARRGFTQRDIGEVFGCDQSTVSRRFGREFRMGFAQMKIDLRLAQWRRAARGSDAMLIHLGKVYLGQADRIDIAAGPTYAIFVDHQVGSGGNI
jgi:AraC-like DNA-binding protein